MWILLLILLSFIHASTPGGYIIEPVHGSSHQLSEPLLPETNLNIFTIFDQRPKYSDYFNNLSANDFSEYLMMQLQESEKQNVFFRVVQFQTRFNSRKQKRKTNKMTKRYQVVVAGGGLLGLSCAYHLSLHLPKNVSILLLESEPHLLSQTSSASTGGFRNFYPLSPSMTALSNLSIDKTRQLKMESNNRFEMVETGYTFVSTRQDQMNSYEIMANKAHINGSGNVYSNSLAESQDGICLVNDPNLISRHYPSLSSQVQSLMRVNKAGYLNVEKLGEYLYQKCLENHVDFMHATLDQVHMNQSNVKSISVMTKKTDNGPQESVEIHTNHVLLAVGPHLKQLGKKMGLDFPLMNELHARVQFEDPLGLIPEESPFLIWSDDVEFNWYFYFLSLQVSHLNLK